MTSSDHRAFVSACCVGREVVRGRMPGWIVSAIILALIGAAWGAESNQPASVPFSKARFSEVPGPPSAELVWERARKEAAVERDQCGNLWRLAPSTGETGPITIMVSNDPGGIQLKAPPVGKPLTPGGWTMLKVDAWSFVWAAGKVGLYRLDPRRTESSWLEFPARERLGGAVAAIGLSPDGSILVGTDKGALYEFDFTEKDLPVARRFDLAGLPPTPVTDVCTDRQGAVWASCDGRTYKTEPATDAWQRNWEELAAMPFGSHDVFGAELGGKLYVPGGMASHGLPARFTYFPEMFVLDPNAGWSMTQPMSRPLCYSGVAVLDGKVWVVGGGENQETDRNKNQKRVAVDMVHIYDPTKGTWDMGPSLPEPRMEAIVTVVNGRIYCCMGSMDANAKGRTAVLSIATGEKSWRTEPNAPLTGGQSSGCALDGIIYIAASRTGLVAFDPAGGKWDTNLPRIPSDAAPSASLCAAHKGEVWVMGGSGTKTPRATWRYNPKTKQWAAGPDLPTPLCWGAATEVSGRLIIAGGGYRSHGTYVFPNRAYRLRE